MASACRGCHDGRFCKCFTSMGLGIAWRFEGSGTRGALWGLFPWGCPCGRQTAGKEKRVVMMEDTTMSLPIRIVRHSDVLEAAQREFDQVFGRLIGGGQATGAAPYAVDVKESGETLVVEAELPGFTKDQVNITLENSVLTLAAERAAPVQTNAQGEYLLKERRHARFQRSFSLPPTVDEASVNARLENGVLTVTLNKRLEAKPRKISVA